MKDFLDWLLEQIGDAMLITATLAILRNIAKGWLEAYWPQNEEEEDETGTETQNDADNKSESTNSSVFETDDDYHSFINRLLTNCANFAAFLLERKENENIYSLTNVEKAIVFYHRCLIKDLLEKEFLTITQSITVNVYGTNLEQCLLHKKMTSTDCVGLLIQLREVVEILKVYAQ